MSKFCKACVHYGVCKYSKSAYAEVNCRDFIRRINCVEVVRCIDCKYSSFLSHCSKYKCERTKDVLFFCNDFCAYGKRKEV